MTPGLQRSARLLQVLGACLGVQYLLLGCAAVLIFILAHTGLITGPGELLRPATTAAVLAGVLVTLMLGFTTSILLVIAASSSSSRLVIPWLVVHIVFILTLILGGTGLFFHLLINLAQPLRAVLCLIPVMTGALLIFVWTKIYQKYFIIKTLKRLQKIELLQQFYNHQTYYAFHNKQVDGKLLDEPHFESHRRSLTSVVLPEDQNNDPEIHQSHEIPRPMELMEDHVYVNEAMTRPPEAMETLSRVVSIDIGDKKSAILQHNYFYGDTFGVLPCKKCNRSLETLEASIIFGEEQEKDIGDKLVSFTHSITPLVNDEDENIKIKINDKNEVESPGGLYSPGVLNTLTKDEIVEIFCGAR